MGLGGTPKLEQVGALQKLTWMPSTGGGMRGMEDPAAPADFFEEARGISGESADCSPSAPSFPGNIFGKTKSPESVTPSGDFIELQAAHQHLYRTGRVRPGDSFVLWHWQRGRLGADVHMREPGMKFICETEGVDAHGW